MQPATNPEDIKSILTRFEAWSVQQPENGKGQLHAAQDEVREITYDEAIRNFRQRQPDSRRTVRSSKSRAVDSSNHAGELTSRAALSDEAKTGNNASAAITGGVETVAPATNADGSAIPAMRAGVATAEELQTRSKTKRKAVAKKTRSNSSARKAPLHATRSGVSADADAGIEPAIESRRGTSAGKELPRNVTTPEFGKILTRSLRQSPGKTKKEERSARISIRFSATEERQLRHAAFEAGLTVSAYLRNRVLVAKPLSTIRTVVEKVAVPEPASPAVTGLGKRIARKLGEYFGWELAVSE